MKRVEKVVGKRQGVNNSTHLIPLVAQEIERSEQKEISMARLMELGLFHEEFGYYSTKEKIFNKGGDFVTSPEIS